MTCHEDFSRKLCCELFSQRLPFFVRAVRSISLEKQISVISCVFRDSYVLENHSPPDRISLFSRRNFEG